MSSSHPLSPDILLPSIKDSQCFVFIFLESFLEIGDSEILLGLETTDAQRACGDNIRTAMTGVA